MRKIIRLLIIMLSMSIIHAAAAKDAKMNVESFPIDPLFNPSTPIRNDQYAEQQSAFIASTSHYLNGRYSIIDQRIFVYAKVPPDISPQWVVISGDIDNFTAKQGGKIVAEGLDVPGIAAIRIFKLGLIHPQYFALVMSKFLPDGNALIAYLELKKE